jgi:hypothetical protein
MLPLQAGATRSLVFGPGSITRSAHDVRDHRAQGRARHPSPREAGPPEDPEVVERPC